MEPDGLFDLDEAPVPAPPVDPPSATSPLAVRMRPRTLDEVVGQAHLLRPGAPLRRLVEGGTAGVGAALRAARHREDHDRTAAGRARRSARRAAFRGAVGAVVGGAGSCAR